MKVDAVFPDAERAVVGLLTDLLAALEPSVTVGVTLPDGWNVDANDPHVQVAWDGTPRLEAPIVAYATVRLVAYASGPTRAKEVVARAQALLCGTAGRTVDGVKISTVTPLTGVLPARDPASRAHLASCTVQVALRSQLL